MAGGRTRVDKAVVALAAAIFLLSGLGVASVIAQPAREDGSRASRAVVGLGATTTSTAAPRTAPAPAETAVGPGPVPAPPPSLKAALDSVWSQTPAGCLSVAAGGRVLYEANATQAMAPASAIKILTAAAALDVLGRDSVLTTTVRADPLDATGRVAGDLWIVGGGDPLLGTTAWAAETERAESFTPLERLADRVVAAGVTRIDGRIVGDESRYDRARYVDSWPKRFLDDGEAGPLSALTVNGGFREWGHPGVPFDDPPAGAAALFAELLAQRGVVIGGGFASGIAPPDSSELASVTSAPIGQLVQRMVRESENGVAELFVKEVGLKSAGVGTTAAGVREVVAVLERRGFPASGSTIADGSGLSDDDRVSCRLLMAVIGAAPADVLAGLPVAGRDGTLERRFVGTPVSGRLRAKTGSLDGVAALAGTVQTVTGGSLTFAYLVNGLPRDDSGRRLQDALATALVTTG